MNSPLRPIPDAIDEFLKIIGVGPKHIVELRVLCAKVQGSSWPQTRSGFFNDRKAMVRSICQIEKAMGWYVTLNPCLPDLLSRRCNRVDRVGEGETTRDSQILHRRWLPIDVDPIRLPGISATEEEHQEAIALARSIAAYLRSMGWPAPIIGDSGNGGHLLCPVDLPREDGGLVERCLKSLDQKFSSPTVKVDTANANPARIWKIYGTPACKGDSTDHRPHRMAKLLEIPDGL